MIIDRIAKAFGYARKSVGLSLLGSMARNMGGSPRPTVHNMGQYLGRYADQAWVFACVDLVASKAAEVPLKVYSVSATGEKKHLATHPLQTLLDSANPRMNGYDLREANQGFIELTGNSYWLKDEIVAGKAKYLYLLNPQYVRLNVDKDKGVTGYFYEINGVKVATFAPEEILHFHNWNPLDEFYGMARISAARDSSDSLASADKYNKNFFENSAEAGGVLQTKEPMSDEEGKRVLSSWESTHRGISKAHSIALLHNGLEFKPTTVTHRDMQFPELKKMTREDILAVYRVPPVMLGLMDEGNVSKKEQRKVFWQDSMLPRLRKNESVINEFLVPDYGGGIVVAYDLSGIEDLQEDAKSRAEEDKILTDAGILIINEARKARNLPPVPWGDTWNAPMGLMPIDQERHQLPATPAPAPKDDPEDTPEPPKPAPKPPKEPKAAAPEAKDAPKDAAKDRRDASWAMFKASTEAHERRWKPAIRSLFTEQEREVIRNLNDSNWKGIVDQAKLQNMKGVKGIVDVILFDEGDARKAWRKVGVKLLTMTFGDKARSESAKYDLGDFSIVNPKVQEWINSKAFKFADEVNKTTEDELRAALGDAITAGESISDVSKRIGDVFDMARDYRTDRIARTEVISASNAGAMASYEQSGVVQTTEWITARDSDVRDTHTIDGEQANLGAAFSNGLKYPGEPGADASEVCNCRCTIGPVINRS